MNRLLILFVGFLINLVAGPIAWSESPLPRRGKDRRNGPRLTQAAPRLPNPNLTVVAASTKGDKDSAKEKQKKKKAKKKKHKKKNKVKEPDVNFAPTPPDVVIKMLELAQVKKGETVYDLGSGDGRIVLMAAKKFGAKGVGIELDSKLVRISRKSAKKMGVEELVSFHKQDMFTVDLRPADVVTLYILPEMNVKLVPQLKKLKPGARIVSHWSGIKGYKPDKVLKILSKDGYSHPLYLWIAPLK